MLMRLIRRPVNLGGFLFVDDPMRGQRPTEDLDLHVLRERFRNEQAGRCLRQRRQRRGNVCVTAGRRLWAEDRDRPRGEAVPIEDAPE